MKAVGVFLDKAKVFRITKNIQAVVLKLNSDTVS